MERSSIHSTCPCSARWFGAARRRATTFSSRCSGCRRTGTSTIRRHIAQTKSSFLAMATSFSHSRCSEQLVDRGTHFVRWGSILGGTSLGATIGSDNEQGGFDATEHLLQGGRRRIALIGTARTRLSGVPRTLAGLLPGAASLQIDPDPRLRGRC